MNLPKDVLKTIRRFASDMYEHTPTAKLVKTLKFEYKDASNIDYRYRPYRLEVTTQDHFSWIDFTHPHLTHIWNVQREPMP